MEDEKVARSFTIKQKTQAWNLWMTGMGIGAIARKVRVRMALVEPYIRKRQKEKDDAAAVKRKEEIERSRIKPKWDGSAAMRRRREQERQYRVEDELTKHPYPLGVVMALNSLRDKRKAEEILPTERRSQVDILLEIRSRIDEVLNIQGVKINLKKEDSSG